MKKLPVYNYVLFFILSLLLVPDCTRSQTADYTLSKNDNLENLNSIFSREIKNVFYDRFHYCWIFSSSGLYRFDGLKIISFDNLTSKPVNISWQKVQKVFRVSPDEYVFSYSGNSSFSYILFNTKDYSVKEVDFSEFFQANNENYIFVTSDEKDSIYVFSGNDKSEILCYKLNVKSQQLDFRWKKKHSKKPTQNSILGLVYKQKGIFLCRDKGFFSIEPGLNVSLQKLNSQLQLQDYSDITLFTFSADKSKIYIGGLNLRGIISFNLLTHRITNLNVAGDVENFTHFWQDVNGTELFGTSRTFREITSIYRLDNLNLTEFNDLTEQQSNITCLAGYDFNKNIAVGSHLGFSHFVQKNKPIFRNYLDEQLDDNRRFGILIRNIFELDSTILITREVDNWYHFYPSLDKVEPLELRNGDTNKELKFQCGLEAIKVGESIYATGCLGEIRDFVLLKVDPRTGISTVFPAPIIADGMTYDGDSTIYLVGDVYRENNRNCNFFTFNIYTEKFSCLYDIYGETDELEGIQLREVKFDRERNKLWVGHIFGLTTIDLCNKTYDTKEIQFEKGGKLLSQPEVLNIYMDSSRQNIYLGTRSYGLVIYELYSGIFTKVDASRGVSSNTVYNIFLHENLLFNCTERGLTILDLEMGFTYSFFQEDGLPANELNTNSYEITKDQEVILGTVNGFTNFTLRDIYARPTDFKIILERVVVKDKNGSVIQEINNKLDSETIAINKKAEVLDLYFVQPGNFSDKIYYHADLNDVSLNNQTEANVSTVSLSRPGDGKYKINASSFFIQNGVRHNAASFQLLFEKRLYERYLFWIIVFILLSVLIYTIQYIVVQNTLSKERKEMEIRSQFAHYELKALRSQMNPHFIFNSITAIQYYITDRNSKSANKYLSKFGKLMRSILENTREKFITLGEELRMLENYIQLEQMRMDDKFDYFIEVDNKLNIDDLKIPSMILQPIIENSLNHGIFHSDKDNLYLKIQFYLNPEEKLVCLIEDNGIGRKRSSKIYRKSIRKHKSRATQIINERIEALQTIGYNLSYRIKDLHSDSGEGTGTRVTIYFQ